MAQNIIALYRSLHQRILQLRQQEQTLSGQLAALESSAKSAAVALQPTYQQELAAIDEALRRLDIYIAAARDYGHLRNYTPVPEKVHPAVLQQLYTVLDGSASGKTAAMELHKKCANAAEYYRQEKARLSRELQQKQQSLNHSAAAGPEATALKSRLERIRQEYSQLASGPDARQLAEEMQARSSAFFTRRKIYRISVPTENPQILCVGFAYFPYPLGKEYGTQLQNTFGSFYLPQEQTLLIPVSIHADGCRDDGLYLSANISVTYDNSTRDKAYEVTQGLLFNILRSYVPLRHRVTYLDLDTYNPEQLGFLKAFIGEDGFISCPRNTAQAKAALQALLNAAASEPENRRQRRYLFIRGMRTSGSELTELVRKICNDLRKNNISTVFIDRQDDRNSAYGWFSQLFFTLTVTSNGSHFVSEQWGDPLRFGFLAAPLGLESDSEAAFLALCKPKVWDNRYESFFPLNRLPDYLTKTRQRERITLPYGMDEKTGQISSITFEDMNFASFLMGGSGSGKTTLIHAIIAGIIRNYHPDEVELWLADFKEAGFAPYEQNMPPHIRYIVMDSSPEMVCAFIDKLYGELTRRKTLLRSTDDRLNVPVEQYLPAIFVIIDEFAAISETVRSRPKHQDRLTALMTQGRSMGFRFIFSSQGFSGGAGALNPLAKDQIQARIAMAHQNPEEIRNLLGLPRMTEDASEKINNLKPHYILYKNPLPDGYILSHCLGLYFPGSSRDVWNSRYAFFSRISGNMKKVEEKDYDSRKPGQYVDKKPIVCGSAALSVYSPKQFTRRAAAYRADPMTALSDEDVIVDFGQPRSLEADVYTFLTHSARENIFLLTNREEAVCTMSVLLSAIRSVRQQDTEVQVWGHRSNPIYRSYRQSHFAKLSLSEGKEAVCKAMEQLAQKIQNRQRGNALIVLLGIDRICEELADDSESFPFNTSLFASPEAPVLKSVSPAVPLSADGKLELSQEELDAIEAQLTLAGKPKAGGKQKPTDFPMVDDDDEDDEDDENLLRNLQRPGSQPKKPDYRKLFRNLLEHGSRNGYHFLLCIDDYNKLRDMDLNLKSFNHRLAFQTDSVDTSSLVFSSSQGATLAPNVCLYSGIGAANSRFLITPWLHSGVTWGNWIIDGDGNARNLSTI